MQTPYRKPGKYTNLPFDPHITQTKYDSLASSLDRLANDVKPYLMQEVSRLAQNGDFSENAEYQIAKGRLRGLNRRILTLERQLAIAEIIDPKQFDTVEIGHKVTVDAGGIERDFTILGKNEIDLEKGIISYTSPIGAALIGARVGDEVTVMLPKGDVLYRILNIS